VADECHRTRLPAHPPAHLPLHLLSQPVGAARVERDGREDWRVAHADKPGVQRLQVHVVAEQTGHDQHQATVAAWHADAVVDRVAPQLGQLAHRPRFLAHYVFAARAARAALAAGTRDHLRHLSIDGFTRDWRYSITSEGK